jgi:Glycosyltransferase family 87
MRAGIARRPPLPLAAATMAAAWGAAYTAVRWVTAYASVPIHDDVRYDYVAAEAGLRYGWSRIYDQSLLARLSAGFPAPQNTIHPGGTFINPPLLAWLWAPLVAFPEPVAYAAWTVLGLAALAWTWYVAAPFTGLGKVAMLLAALALWPVLEAFYFGQPTVLVLALVATSWWLMGRQQPVAAGAALALAAVLKPQVVAMVPLCLLVAGRWRVVSAAAIAAALLAAASALTLGASGLADLWATLQWIQTDRGHAFFTVAYLFGLGPVTYLVLAAQGALCVAASWRRRRDLDAVFAIGLLGSLMVSFHLHQPDYCNLVLAAWLVLRGAPSLVGKAWLGAGFVTMQVLTMGVPWPQLAWDLGWLLILGFVEAEDAQKEAREHRLHAQRQEHGGGDDLAHGQARV